MQCVLGARSVHGNDAAALLSSTHVSYTDTSCTVSETGTQTSATVRLISAKCIPGDLVFGRVSSESSNQRMHLVLVFVSWTIEQS